MKKSLLVFLNTLLLLVYVGITEFTAQENLFAFLTLFIFAFGVIIVGISSGFFRPHYKPTIREHIFFAIRTVSFLTVPLQANYRHNVALYIISIVIMLILDSWQFISSRAK